MSRLVNLPLITTSSELPARRDRILAMIERARQFSRRVMFPHLPDVDAR
jgi:hypothetical protein